MARGRSNYLSEKEFKFCCAYLTNGMKAHLAAITAGYAESTAMHNSCKILKRPAVQEHLKAKRQDMENDFNYKLRKLKHGIELALPDDAISYKDCNIMAAKACINEMNLMQGHFSAQKIVNVSTSEDADVEKVKKVLHELKDKYDKEY